jgi:tripartite-type tricarboxylate transporter receptor subunit TctC
MELFKSVAGFDAVHVPFNGSPPAVKATVQNETQMMFAVMQPLQAQIEAGTLRALAVTTSKRFPLLPDLPAIAESGYPGFEALAWNGVLVAANTPKPIIARLNAEMNAILKAPEMQQKMQGFGFDLIGGTPEDFGALISGEAAKWAPVIKKVGLKVD